MDCSPPGSSVQGILQARILEWVSTPSFRRRQWQATPVLLPRKSHGQRSLVGYSPWGRKELDTTERLHFHFSLSYIGEGNGNPLQCSCLENPKEGGAWWAAVYRVTQSRTRLKRLSSSSPPPGDLFNPGIKPKSLMSPELAGQFFITSTTWEALINPPHVTNMPTQLDQ